MAKQIHITPAIPSCLGGSREAKKYSDYGDDDSDTQDDDGVDDDTVTIKMIMMVMAPMAMRDSDNQYDQDGDTINNAVFLQDPGMHNSSMSVRNRWQAGSEREHYAENKFARLCWHNLACKTDK